MKALLEEELQRILEDMVEDFGDAPSVPTYDAALHELRSAVETLRGRLAPTALFEACTHCHGTKWRREGASGIACSACGTLAKAVALA